MKTLLIFLSLACGGCLSYSEKDGVVHFASVGQNIQRLEFEPRKKLIAEGVDSEKPITGIVKTAGLISIGKMATSGVTGVATDAVQKIGE